MGDSKKLKNKIRLKKNLKNLETMDSMNNTVTNDEFLRPDLSKSLRRISKDFAVLGKDIKRSCIYWKDHLSQIGTEKLIMLNEKYINRRKIN